MGVGVGQRAFGHGAHHRLADGAVRVDQLGGHAQQLVFGGVGVADKAALKPLARPRQLGAGRSNQAAGAAFCRGQPPAAGQQLR